MSEAKRNECPVERVVIPKTPDDHVCSYCGDEHYLLQGCCDGRECGCMGQPTAVSVCKRCNPDGKKEMGEYTESYAQYVEFIEV